MHLPVLFVSRGRPLTSSVQAYFVPLPVPRHPWSHLALDFVTGVPASEGNTVALTIVDRFSTQLNSTLFIQHFKTTTAETKCCTYKGIENSKTAKQIDK